MAPTLLKIAMFGNFLSSHTVTLCEMPMQPKSKTPEAKKFSKVVTSAKVRSAPGTPFSAFTIRYPAWGSARSKFVIQRSAMIPSFKRIRLYQYTGAPGVMSELLSSASL